VAHRVFFFCARVAPHTLSFALSRRAGAHWGHQFAPRHASRLCGRPDLREERVCVDAFGRAVARWQHTPTARVRVAREPTSQRLTCTCTLRTQCTRTRAPVCAQRSDEKKGMRKEHSSSLPPPSATSCPATSSLREGLAHSEICRAWLAESVCPSQRASKNTRRQRMAEWASFSLWVTHKPNSPTACLLCVGLLSSAATSCVRLQRTRTR
jgi:hypothetical protein